MKRQYSTLALMQDHQNRGYQFEKFLKELFKLFDIDLKGPFKIEGEQIDGAFTLDSVEYLT